jgi:hypothetical protein
MSHLPSSRSPRTPRTALCKGTLIQHARTFVGAREGKEGWSSLVGTMSEDDQGAIGGVVSIGWYEEHLFARLLRALDDRDTRKAASRGGGRVRELARFEAEQDLTVVHRVFLRLANPAYVLEKAGEYWGRFHDTGAWVVTRRGPRAASGELRGWGVVDAVYCAYLAAYIERTFELVGATDVACAHQRCRARRDEACVFEGHWA